MVDATVAASNAERVIRFGVARGVDPKRAGEIDALRIPAQRMFGIWRSLARDLSDPALPIAIAETSTVEDVGLLGFATVTAPTARRAIETFIKYSALLNDGARWEILDDGPRLEVRMTGPGDAADPGVRMSRETGIAQLVGGARQLCGTAIDPELVAFEHTPSRASRAHRAFFRCPIENGAPFQRVVFRRDVFDVVPRSANVPLWTWLCGRAEEELRAIAPRPILARIQDEISRAFAHDLDHDMRAVAARAGTTERTLRRVLAKEGVTYRALVDGARKERARRLLVDEDVSITRAALDAGFADASAFTHACHRWFGRAPSEVRKRAPRITE